MPFFLRVTFLLFVSGTVFGKEIRRERSSFDDGLSNHNLPCYPSDSCKAGVNEDSPVPSLGNECSCHRQCWEYGTCCVDSPYRIALPIHKCNRDYSYYMVHRCPENTPNNSIWKSPCEREWNGDDDILMLSPVTSLVTSRSYKNYYCFKCHETTDRYLPWDLKVSRRHTAVEDGTVDSLFYNQGEKTVTATLHKFNFSIPVRMYFEFPPHVEDERLFPCDINLIEDCPRTWSDERIHEKCLSYRAVVYHKSSSYKNVHCAMCNFVPLHELTCPPSAGYGGSGGHGRGGSGGYGGQGGYDEDASTGYGGRRESSVDAGTGYGRREGYNGGGGTSYGEERAYGGDGSDYDGLGEYDGDPGASYGGRERYGGVGASYARREGYGTDYDGYGGQEAYGGGASYDGQGGYVGGGSGYGTQHRYGGGSRFGSDGYDRGGGYGGGAAGYGGYGGQGGYGGPLGSGHGGRGRYGAGASYGGRRKYVAGAGASYGGRGGYSGDAGAGYGGRRRYGAGASYGDRGGYGPGGRYGGQVRCPGYAGVTYGTRGGYGGAGGTSYGGGAAYGGGSPPKKVSFGDMMNSNMEKSCNKDTEYWNPFSETCQEKSNLCKSRSSKLELCD